MKTNSINQKARKTRTFVLALVLFPVLSFASMSKTSYLLSTDSNQYAALEPEKIIDWKSDLSTRSIMVSVIIKSEEELTVEKWMIDVTETFWHAEGKEEEIQIEEWMYNLGSDSWMPKSDDEEIKIEYWMCNPSAWLVSK